MSTAGSHALAGGERRVARAACRGARAQREHAQRSLLPGGQQSRGGSKQGRVTVAQWVLAPHTRRRAQLWPSGSGGEHAGREGGRDTQCPSSDVLEAGAGGVLDLVWRDQSDCDLFVHVSSVPMVSLQCVRRGIHNDYYKISSARSKIHFLPRRSRRGLTKTARLAFATTALFACFRHRPLDCFRNSNVA